MSTLAHAASIVHPNRSAGLFQLCDACPGEGHCAECQGSGWVAVPGAAPADLERIAREDDEAARIVFDTWAPWYACDEADRLAAAPADAEPTGPTADDDRAEADHWGAHPDPLACAWGELSPEEQELELHWSRLIGERYDRMAADFADTLEEAERVEAMGARAYRRGE